MARVDVLTLRYFSAFSKCTMNSRTNCLKWNWAGCANCPMASTKSCRPNGTTRPIKLVSIRSGTMTVITIFKRLNPIRAAGAGNYNIFFILLFQFGKRRKNENKNKISHSHESRGVFVWLHSFAVRIPFRPMDVYLHHRRKSSSSVFVAAKTTTHARNCDVTGARSGICQWAI